MCEFVSWVEKGERVYFLTPHLIYNTPRGDIIQKRFPGDGEIIGHTAIRAYWQIREGEDKECTDFSTPDNLPEVIVKAIKHGDMTGLNISVPKGILRKSLDDDYEAKRKSLYDGYWALVADPKNRSRAWK